MFYIASEGVFQHETRRGGVILKSGKPRALFLCLLNSKLKHRGRMT